MNEQAALLPKRILLTDDQPEVRGVIRMMLELDLHLVTEAASGPEALALFAPGCYDLVMTDYAMPAMTGDALARRIKQLDPDQPVLMVTGSAQPSDDFDHASDALLRKPFSLPELRQAIAGLCSVCAR